VRFTGADPSDRAPEALPELAALMAAGKLTIPVWRTYPLAEAARAHADLEAGRNQGKINPDPLTRARLGERLSRPALPQQRLAMAPLDGVRRPQTTEIRERESDGVGASAFRRGLHNESLRYWSWV